MLDGIEITARTAGGWGAWCVDWRDRQRWRRCSDRGSCWGRRRDSLHRQEGHSRSGRDDADVSVVSLGNDSCEELNPLSSRSSVRGRIDPSAGLATACQSTTFYLAALPIGLPESARNRRQPDFLVCPALYFAASFCLAS